MVNVLGWMLASLVVTTIILVAGRKLGASFIISTYTALIVMAQIFANKLVVFGNWIVPAGVIVYAISFLLTDALNEFYGKEEARKAVISGFAASLLLVLGIQIAIGWEPAYFWEGQAAFAQTLGLTWRIVVASLLAYLVSQNWDIFLFQFIKQKTAGRHLWMRNILSTVTSQLLDTVLFITIAFWGTLPREVVIGMVGGQFAVKLLIALMDTPFLYAMRPFYRARTPEEGTN